MTRIFTDGAEMGDVLFFDVPGVVTNITTAPRSGSRHYYVRNDYAQKNITAVAEAYFRVPMRFTDSNNAAGFFRWRSGTTELGSVRRNVSSGKLEIYTGSGALRATGNIALLIDTWYCVEVHVKIDDAVGAIDVRLDGISEVAFAGDTKPSTETTIDNLQYYQGNNSNTFYFDDLAMNDTAGGVDNLWCGDGKIVMLRPTAAGDATQLAPSAGANWECVDEVPPNTTDYVSSATAGQYDLYNCGTHALATGEVIRRAQVEARALEESALGDSIKLGVKTEATEYFDAGQAVLTSYRRYVGDDLPLNPNTGIAWTQAELDALQVGVKVV